MIKEKKSHKGIINIVLIIGIIIFCVGLYQIGTVSFLSTNMENIDDDWVPAKDEESRGYYRSYNENDTIKIIGQIGYIETIDNVIINPTELFEENMTGVFEDLKEKGYRYIYQFYNSEIMLVAENYYEATESYYDYESHVESFNIKLHDWFLGDAEYWIWTIESKGESPITTIVYSIPLLLIGIVIFIIGGLTKLRNKVYEGKIKVSRWIQNKLVDDERVIAKVGKIYATDRRLLNCKNRFNFKFLEFDQITDITYEKCGIGWKIVLIFLLSLCSLIYIILIPDMLGYPYQIGEIWVNPISSRFAPPNAKLMYTATLVVVGFNMVLWSIEFPSRYLQFKGINFNKKDLHLWKFNLPYYLKEQAHNFIKIVNKERNKKT